MNWFQTYFYWLNHIDWFQRHLNWTMVLGYLLANVVSFMLNRVPPLGTIAAIAIGLPVAAWVISQKGRSLWWLLLSGLFSPLWLTNKKTESLTS